MAVTEVEREADVHRSQPRSARFELAGYEANKLPPGPFRYVCQSALMYAPARAAAIAALTARSAAASSRTSPLARSR
jgi:hypothetical protein